MEYEVVCPQDGPMLLGYAAFRRIEVIDADRARLTFECPRCERDLSTVTEVPTRIDEMLESYSRLRIEDARRVWRRGDGCGPPSGGS